MRGSVRKWGNSASVRIPSSVMDAARVSIDQAVDIRAERGRIVIEPVRQEGISLGDLLSKITPDNLHVVIEFGAPAGNEAF